MTRAKATHGAKVKALSAPPQLIPLSCIRDGGAQMRVEMSPDIIHEYAEAMLNGAVFPPVTVFYDGTDYWPGDGYHRIEAARKIGREDIDAEVRQGTARDAILCGVGSNAFHGLRRTQADRRKAIVFLLSDPEWARLSDRKLGEIANVDHKTIGKIRRELTEVIHQGRGGEIPHSKTPKPSGKPNGKGGSILESVLNSVSDEALVTECRRRGIVVEASDV